MEPEKSWVVLAQVAHLTWEMPEVSQYYQKSYGKFSPCGTDWVNYQGPVELDDLE